MRPPVTELTTVADDVAVVHHGDEVRVYDGLRPGTDYRFDGVAFTTLERPGELLARVATVNDLHFGEVAAGALGDLDVPIMRPDGPEPHPEFMNADAAAEIAAIAPMAVVVKGDVTDRGRPEELEAFRRCYAAFDERLVVTAGNHDAYGGSPVVGSGPVEVVREGVRLAVIDTVSPGRTSGRLVPEQLEWLDELAARSDRPVLVFGHHQIWDQTCDPDAEWFFGIAPRDAERLIEVVARRPQIRGYFAGHTHRNRVLRLAATGARPWVEVACVKDFPGSWAEYRVFDGGILQVHHRISTPRALAWSNRARDLYQPIDYVDYAFGELGDRCFAL